MTQFTVSSNHVSTDQQAKDALDWLRLYRPDAYVEVRKHFPENLSSQVRGLISKPWEWIPSGDLG